MGLMVLEQGESTYLREIGLLSGLRRLRRNNGGYLVDLLAREEMRETGAASGAATVAGCDGAGVPGVGCNIIEGDTFAGFVQVSQVGLGVGVALLGGETFPADSFGIIHWDAGALEIEDAKIVLGGGEAEIGSSAKPLGRQSIVTRSAYPGEVDRSQVGLPDGIAMLCRGEIPIEGKGGIFVNAVTLLIECGQIIRGVGMAFQGGCTVVLCGLCIISGDSLAVFIEVAEEEFAVDIALGSGCTSKGNDRLVVRGGGIIAKIYLGECILGHGVAMIGA